MYHSLLTIVFLSGTSPAYFGIVVQDEHGSSLVKQAKSSPEGRQPAGGEELLPLPKDASPRFLAPGTGPGLDPMYFRKNRYDVWQFYGVDRQNMWRPRVIYAPAGAYYLYNGAPFPWSETHQREFIDWYVSP
jgi:hypothetical protein